MALPLRGYAMARRPFISSQSRVLKEAADAFAGLDEFVERLVVSRDDDGAAAVLEMQKELRARTARFAHNPVVASTALGLENAYRLSILQRVIDARFGTRRAVPDNTARRRKLESS